MPRARDDRLAGVEPPTTGSGPGSQAVGASAAAAVRSRMARCPIDMSAPEPLDPSPFAVRRAGGRAGRYRLFFCIFEKSMFAFFGPSTMSKSIVFSPDWTLA
jgi:hypothetical protein